MTETLENENLSHADRNAELPPVEPPTVGFVVQLFGIPLAIVAVAVVVWLLFGKIATSHRTPQDYLEDLRSPNFERRWSAARDLASILPHNKEWQNDEGFAEELAAELEARLVDGRQSASDTRYLQYVAAALGEFNSPAAIPVLQQAMKPEMDRDVREAAVLAIGGIANRIGAIHDPQVIADLAARARDEDSKIRTMATWVLGRTGNSQAVERLIPLLGDSDPEVRLNAAASLARLGSTAGLDTLEEMLDPDELRNNLAARGLSNAKIESQLVAIPLAALQSLAILLEKSPEADLEPIRPRIEQHTHHEVRMLRTRASELLIEMDRISQQR